jgi:hypothetical protein
MENKAKIIAARREAVIHSYNSAEARNKVAFMEGDEKATFEYIYENQKIDANNIVREFYENNRRVVSVTKKTKVGADGLMIEVAKLMTTHPDDDFVVNPVNARIITGMSNVAWEKDMKEKSPSCFSKHIFHHGQLTKADLKHLSNALIIVDEIDSGDKEYQLLHKTLKDSGVLDVNYMEEKNIRFMFISATMIKELYDLYKWGELHNLYCMTIPSSYIGHIDFLHMGIIQDFYPLNTSSNANKWIKEDILDYYKNEYRVHLVRINKKMGNIIQNECIRSGILYRDHTSADRLTDIEIYELFKKPLTNHVVLGIKGFFRRANLIPNDWKKRIGATHEMYTKKVDNTVQIQAFPGRMTGYWRYIIEGGHKIGPYRTSIKAIQEYEATYNSPFGCNSYTSSGFKKDRGMITLQTATFVTHHNIIGIVPTSIPQPTDSEFERGHQVFDTQAENEIYAKQHGATRKTTYTTDEKNFKQCSTSTYGVHSLEDIIKFTKSPNPCSNLDKAASDVPLGGYAYRRYVCYRDVTNINTECFVTIWAKRIRPVAPVVNTDAVVEIPILSE